VPGEQSRASGFGVRFGWGLDAVEAEARRVAVVVVVDVLRFTTAVDAAVSVGAHVHPYRWRHDSAAAFARSVGARLADGRGDGPEALSLSPHSLRSLAPDESVVLPSPHGSTCAVRAAELGAAVVAVSLRNAAAVARWLNSDARPVAVVACGEHWPDGSFRPAIEDLLGAGALIADLDGGRAPEADAAAAAWWALESRAAETLASSETGRQLARARRADDVAFAGEVDASACVPVLIDGRFSDQGAGHPAT
jgi:2-phosphosulfolactate phosphatase